MGYVDDLSHAGIPGMKWGNRRFQYEDGTLTPAGRERYRKKKASGRSKTTKQRAGLFGRKVKPEPEPSKKSISEMSDDELRNIISRAQLEKQYRELVAPPNTRKGRNVVMEILGGAAKDVAKTYTKKIMITGIDTALDKMGIELKSDSSKSKKDKKDDD